jgi:FkbM family methyltransferase
MNIDPVLYDIFFKEYKLNSGDTAFSLGAGVGEEIEYMSDRVGESGKVFAIEADPHIYKELQTNILKYQYDNVVALNIAITDFVGSIYVVDAGGICNYTTSYKKRNSSLVNCTTMDELTKEFNIDTIDYIKVNIEGDEKQLLNGFKERYSIVKNWCISCHDFTGIHNQRTLEFVKNFFKERGMDCRQYDSNFDFAKFYVYVNNSI